MTTAVANAAHLRVGLGRCVRKFKHLRSNSKPVAIIVEFSHILHVCFQIY